MDNDAGLPVIVFLYFGPGPHPDPSPSLFITRPDSAASQDKAAGGEVRTLYDSHQPLDSHIWIVSQQQDTIYYLTQVVGGNVRGKPNGDPGGSIDQQIRKARWQNRWFLQCLVKVRGEVNSLLLNVS